MTSEPELSPPLQVDDLLGILQTIGVRVELDRSAARPEEQILSLSHGLIGAVEQHAMRAEQAARKTGTTIGEIGQATGEAFNGAGCRTDVDDLALLSWRSQRQAQALGEYSKANGEDHLIRSIALVAAALSGLLSAAHTMRDPHRGPTDTKDSARAVHAAIVALNEAQTTGPGLRVLADLLALTD